MITNCSLVIFFYLNYFLLFPTFFVRKKFFLFFLSLVAFALLFFVIQDYIRSFFFTAPVMHGQNDFHPVRFGPGLFMFFLVAILSTGIQITGEWFKSEQRNKTIENDKLNTELSSLKSQINPHFLFNALNTIYALTITESAKASEAVVKLSKMMRYVIEDSQGNLVDLRQEIYHLENYIEFQKMRANTKLNIDYTFEADGISNYRIAPLILVPFIENAFKYGISSHEACTVKIHLRVEGNKLSFQVNNKIFPSQALTTKETSIGINNTKRRLELIYPEKHDLKVDNEQGMYSIALTINLA